MSASNITIVGQTAPAGKPASPAFLDVGPLFFSTMEIPVLAGREIDERDKAGSPGVALVNQEFVKSYFAGMNPIGRHFTMGRDPVSDFEIVGVAKDARYNTLKRAIQPTAYVAYAQRIRPPRQMTFELRTVGDPLVQANTVRRIVQEMDARIPVMNLRTQSSQIDQTIVQERIFAQLCSSFAILALLIAAVGLYGTLAYTVQRRTREIGVRMALGAQRRRIQWMVVREVVVLGVVGIAIGLPAAFAATRFVESFLFGMKPNDPAAIGFATVVLFLAAILAGYAPAYRASRTDPMIALRHE